MENTGIPYFGISSGKLRRYKSVKNVTDIFRVCKGLLEAIGVLRKIKPDVIFSKGGFVVVPVVAAARILRVKSVIHESDITPGLANKLAMPLATKICVSFPETLANVPKQKGILTGTPIRAELINGYNRAKAVPYKGDTLDIRPVLLVTGGSQGAAAINACVRSALPKILEKFRVIHLCGKGNLSGIKQTGYTEYEYLNEEMADVLAAADIVVSRAGANTIFELAALQKPNLLIPLPPEVSRGDQVQNAASFAGQGFSMVLHEKEMTPERLLENIHELYENREEFIQKMKERNITNGAENIIKVITEVIST
jgi:UDP-N-acetylglucosamine--N-acetylmuramyl-(pentapeptide) pyrophosphoryl-undecaprenol N-acetylglucosamine transferase